jgi:hypothetical protein
MELKEFIKQTIIQITDGLREGHQYVEENDYGFGVRDDKAKEITFDVAISSNEEGTTGIAGKLTVASVFGVSAKDETVTKASNISRIQFKTYLHVKTKKD